MGRHVEQSRIQPKVGGAEDEAGLKGDDTGNPRKLAFIFLLLVATERSEVGRDNP